MNYQQFLTYSAEAGVAAMYQASVQGVWYDPSDMSTLFQDSAGTVPVTAVEQLVGLILDKSGRGNHASQTTTPKRPIYSRRVNSLLNTENPSAWPTNGITGTSEAGGVSLLQSTIDNSVVFPGLQYPIGATTISNSCIYRSIEYLPGGALYLAYGPAAGTSLVTVRTSDGVVVGALGGATNPLRKITPLGDGWVRVETWDSLASHDASRLSILLYFGNTFNGSYVAAGGRAGTQIRVRQLQYVVLPFGSTHSVDYQRVNTATDYDADPAKFPAYLSFDGVDDALQTGNIDFTSTDKMTVWAGVTKLSDAATSIILEHSANWNLNNGTFLVVAQGPSGNFEFGSRGTSQVVTLRSGFQAPINANLSMSANIGGPSLADRINGVSSAVSTLSQGTGNYGNYPLYIGARAGTSFYFNGRLGCLIIRGAYSTESQIAAAERYANSKIGAY